MNAPLPPNPAPPVWATKGFRLFLLFGVFVGAGLLVLIVEIGPKMRDILEHRKVESESAKLTGADVFVPRGPNDPAPATLPYEGIPQRSKDGTPLDLGEEEYVYLVKALSKVDGESIRKDAKRVDYANYGRVPAQLKGTPVKVMGLFLASNPIRLDKPVDGIEWVNRTYLTDMRGEEGYVVDLLQRPPDGVKKKDLVVAYGVFLKLGTYEGNKGQVQAPFLIGKTLHVMPKSAGMEASNLGTLVVGLAVGAVLLALYLTQRHWKSRPKGGSSPAAPLETVS